MNTYSSSTQLLFTAALLSSVVSCAYLGRNSWNSDYGRGGSYGSSSSYGGYGSSSYYDNDRYERDRDRPVSSQQLRAEYGMEVQKERAEYAQEVKKEQTEYAMEKYKEKSQCQSMGRTNC